jgi:hypothetical protein
MNLAVAAAGTLALTRSVAGCGSSPKPTVQPDLAAKPTWGGCKNFVGQHIDYTVDAHGAPTRAAALADYRQEGDHVVDRPKRPHRNARVLLVDDRDVIHHALELWHSQDGWLVTMVQKCTD